MIKIHCFLLSFTLGIVNIFAQNVSGFVKDENGLGIKNALVLKENDPNVWVKTESNGSFSLPANLGDKLKVAALHFQTKNNFDVSTTSNLEIVLSPDPILSTDVYHISFDHLRPGLSYSEAELKKDFPVANGIGFADVDPKDDRASVDINESVDPDGTSLKVKFPKDVLKTSSSGIDVRIPLEGTFKLNTFESKDLYLSYWVKFSDNFDFSKCGGKLPSLGGDYVLDNNRWKGRIMWRNGGSIQFYPELFGKEDVFESDFDRFWGEQLENNGSICTNKFTPLLGTGQWHNIELHYKFETPGMNDGYFEGWVDGDKVHKVTNSDKFGFWLPQNAEDDITINYILLSTFLGGSDLADYAPTEDVYAWFDEFRVSTSRVNEYSKYNYISTDPVTVSLNDNVSSEKEVVFPNPFQDSFSVPYQKDTEIRVFDSSGIMILNTVLEENMTYGDNLLAGTYVVQLANSEGSQQFRLLKTH